MALDKTNLFKLGGATPGLWYYKSTDAVTTIVASGYFNNATNELKEHDVILVVGATGGTETVDVAVVTSATGAATVTTTNGT
jgi:fructoselysine-6-P-deglycase FrlB-like protein